MSTDNGSRHLPAAHNPDAKPNPKRPGMRVFRYRVLLAPDTVIHLNPHHAPVVYALLAAAYGIATKAPPVIPDGVLIEAPEQARVVVNAGEPLALGWTLISVDDRDAQLRSRRLIEGLRSLGARTRHASKPLDGGFQVLSIEDAISGRQLKRDEFAQGVNMLDAHIVMLPTGPESTGAHSPAWRVRLTTPLRMQRPASSRADGHGFVDAAWFCPRRWLAALVRRLREAGLDALCPAGAQDADDDGSHTGTTPGDGIFAPDAAGRRLTWLDLPYQGAGGKKSLGGVIGEFPLPPVAPELWPALFWGQLLGVGRNTTMGLGRYELIAPRLELAATPADPHPPSIKRLTAPLSRSASLLEYALEPGAIDRGAARYDLPSGQALLAAASIRRGDYQPGPTTRFILRDGQRRPRAMTVPARCDRALQVAILEAIAPAVDRYLESSSFAYRSGLGRHSAAKRITELSGQGFRWAVRSDVHRFFDSVDHSVLRARIEAYLPDPPLVELLMQWVSHSATTVTSSSTEGSDPPSPSLTGVGLPTGAPISPVLANLLLDMFDEAVEQSGSRLIRYADDFLLLHRSREEAEQALAVAQSAAEDLRLTLSTAKTQILGPDEAFDFLGFRFERQSDWRFHSSPSPTDIRALGWTDLRDLPKPHAGSVGDLLFPGETLQPPPLSASVAILSPRVTSLDTQGGQLVALDRAGRRLRQLDSRRLQTLLVQGTPELSSSALSRLLESQVEVHFLGRSGIPSASLLPQTSTGAVHAKILQLELSRDEQRCLLVARALVAAKLRNTATTATELIGGLDGCRLAEQLRSLADAACQAASHAQLLGIEGTGAAQWFKLLSSRLPEKFQFANRVAPRARDRSNALLNIIHTHLHRLCEGAIMSVGLLPEIGCLHRLRSGHSALASDLQEPFRHLADRLLWHLAQRLSPEDFRIEDNAAQPMVIAPRAMQLVFRELYQLLNIGVANARDSRTTYREHILRQARNYRRWLLHSDERFQAFQQP
jgi:CRISP-associated protein Cas1